MRGEGIQDRAHALPYGYAAFREQKKGSGNPLPFAVRTGLEPVTPCVTGMYSNQLN